MSIATELARIQTAKENITRALARIGHEVPSGSTLDEYAQYIDPYTSGHTIEWLDNPNHYLAFKFVENGKFGWNASGSISRTIQYSKNGTAWVDMTPGQSISVNKNDEIWVKGTNTGYATSFDDYCYFSTVGKAYISGNINSLIDFPSTLESYYTFYYLFKNCYFLDIDKSIGLSLPATTLSDSYSCYNSMFRGCTSLTTAPELPATTLATNCYSDMFRDCTNLAAAPELPATTLAEGCYQNMFQGCTSLITAPELPVTTLAYNCYDGMFRGCTSLTAAPELPATTLANSCYSSMFRGCTSLTVAPELPAMTLAASCYNNMFDGCISLTTAPELPATTLTGYCYQYMFSGCTSLTSAPELPATTLVNNCYQGMFYGCTSLTTAPELPATTLANYCYAGMFYGCTGLTTAPELPATTLISNCYRQMFYKCTNLNYIKAMFTTTPSSTYTTSWVSGVASSGTFVKNSAAEWDVTGANGIPSGWTVQTAS